MTIDNRPGETGETERLARGGSDRLVAGKTERLARVAWAHLVEPGDDHAALWVELAGGHVEAWQLVRELRSGQSSTTPGPVPRSRLTEGILARARGLEPERVLERTATSGWQLIIPGDPGWPVALDDLEVPPIALWRSGQRGQTASTRLGSVPALDPAPAPALDPAPAAAAAAAAAPQSLPELRRHGVSIVGARDATVYGRQVASDLGAELAVHRWTVVSGGAFGIDAAAHRGALAVAGSTLAVVANGLDRDYPGAHTRLYDEIREAGSVLTELPPGSAPTRWRFLKRNRLIAALTCGTVVVEAGLRSGSLNTARWANDLGRSVGAVPGPVTSRVSDGCHEAVRSGKATLVTCADDVVELLSPVGVGALPHRSAAPLPADGLDDDGARVWSALPVSRGASADALVRRCGLSLGQVREALVELELRGLLVRDDGGYRRTPSKPAADHG